MLSEYSITNAMISGSFSDPIMWPGLQEQSPISITDEGSAPPQSHMSFYS